LKILVTANLVPFMEGGAELHIAGVVRALQHAGHNVQLLRLPFRFSPEADIVRAMAHASSLDLVQPNGISIDQIISLQFPGYGIPHPDHRVWVMHQHRAVYELYDAAKAPPALTELREQVIAFDRAALSRANMVFANSQRVAERLRLFNAALSPPRGHRDFSLCSRIALRILPEPARNIETAASAHRSSTTDALFVEDHPGGRWRPARRTRGAH
jgi:hypothetical protein